MDKNKTKNQENIQREENTREQPQRSSAFNEQSTKDQKSTHNIEVEAGRQQQEIDKGQKAKGKEQSENF